MIGPPDTPAGTVASAPGETPSQVIATTAKPTATPRSTATPKSTAAPRSTVLAIRVTKLTSTVKRGGTASLSIQTAKRAQCDIEVDYASGPSSASGLGARSADAAGLIKWSWRVGSRTTRGTWPIYITCSLGDRYGSVDTAFTVR